MSSSRPELVPFGEARNANAELQALRRMMTAARGTFSLGIAVCNRPFQRDRLIDELRQSDPGIQVVSIPDGTTDVFTHVGNAIASDAEPSAVFVVHLDDRLQADAPRHPILEALNASRELWRNRFACPVVFWLAEFATTLLAVHARDLWAWRSHLFEFTADSHGGAALTPATRADTAGQTEVPDAAAKRRRIRTLLARLARAEDTSSRDVARWHNGLSVLYEVLGEWYQAIAHAKQALAAARAASDRHAEAAALNSLGAAYKALGQWDDALRAHQDSLAICREVSYRYEEGRSLNSLGVVYEAQGRWDDAKNAYGQALAICRKLGNRDAEGQVLANLGGIYEMEGRLDDAVKAYQENLTICRELDNRVGEGRTLNDLGIVYRVQGRLNDAEESHKKSLGISRDFGDRIGEEAALNNLGIVYTDKSQWDDAVQAYQESLAICRDFGDRIGEGQTIENLALLCADRGNTEGALALEREALAILMTTEDDAAAKKARALVAKWEAELNDG